MFIYYVGLLASGNHELSQSFTLAQERAVNVKAIS